MRRRIKREKSEKEKYGGAGQAMGCRRDRKGSWDTLYLHMRFGEQLQQLGDVCTQRLHLELFRHLGEKNRRT